MTQPPGGPPGDSYGSGPQGYPGPPGPPQGYPPQQGYPAPPRTSRAPLIIAVTVVVLALLGAGVFLLFPGDAEAGEIFLSPAASAGPDPFSATPFATPPDPSIAQPAVESDAPIPASPGTPVAARSGGQPGLYGGTRNMSACDARQMVAFLAANPDKAGAWVDALDGDPAVRLPGGQAVTTAGIAAYVATLTPIVLLEDTRVTNHGYRDGRPTTLQSVLQKGTAVLVDSRGVPRVKCYCGNPLLPPVASSRTPRYRGPQWPDFDPGRITVVTENPGGPVDTFVVRVPNTGELEDLPPGIPMDPNVPDEETVFPMPPPQTASGPPDEGDAPARAPSPPPLRGDPPESEESCSAESTTPATIQVTNATNETLEIVWLDQDCNDTAYETLAPGQSYSQPSYVGHFWNAINRQTGDARAFRVGSTSSNWTIR